MRICLDCGCEYEYNTSNPLGASSLRCSPCRKKNTKFAKRARLFEIAGDRCLKCGYSGSIDALKLMDASLPLKKPITQEELEAHAKKQFTICLNCEAELQGKMYISKVISLNPVQVEFYLKDVRVVYTKVESQEVIKESNFDIVTNGGENTRRVNRAQKVFELKEAEQV